MLKLSKRLLALSVSAVLSASVMLTGCGKAEGDADDKPVKAESIGESASAALNTVGNTASNIYDMITGQTDKAYSGQVKLSIGKPLAEELGLDNIKDIIFTSDVKAKNGNIETVFGLTYGKDEIISADMIRDDKTGNVYVGVEQLSPGYLMVSGETLDAYLSEMADDMFDISLDLTGHEGTVTEENFEFPEISDEEIEEWLKPYEQAIKDNIPKGKDKDKVSGEIDGVKYSLDVKSYTITGRDAANVLIPVLKQLKQDENILSLIEAYGATEGLEISDFKDEVDELIDELENGTDADYADTLDFNVYYQDGNIAGISYKEIEDDDWARRERGYEMLWYATETEMCGKYEMTSRGDYKDYPEDSFSRTNTVTCSAKIDNGATDVALKIEATDSYDDSPVKMSFVIDDFQIVDEDSGAFTGTVTFSYSEDDHNLTVTMESKSSSSKLDLSADLKIDGEKYLSVSVTGKETKASDVKIPSKNVYDVNDEAQLEAYGATVDTEKFQKNLKDALGDELYNYLFVGSSSSYYDDWDYDYDWDYDDWDYDYDDVYTGIGRVINS